MGKLMTCSTNSTSRRGNEEKNGTLLCVSPLLCMPYCLCILHDISVKKLKNLKAHLQKNEFSSVVHGNHGQRFHRGYSFEDIKNVATFSKNFVKIHGLPQASPLRGRSSILTWLQMWDMAVLFTNYFQWKE